MLLLVTFVPPSNIYLFILKTGLATLKRILLLNILSCDKLLELIFSIKQQKGLVMIYAIAVIFIIFEFYV